VRHGRSATTFTVAASISERSRVAEALPALGDQIGFSVETRISADEDLLVRFAAGWQAQLAPLAERVPAPAAVLLPIGVLPDRSVFSINWRALGHVLIAGRPGRGADAILGLCWRRWRHGFGPRSCASLPSLPPRRYRTFSPRCRTRPRLSSGRATPTLLPVCFENLRTSWIGLSPTRWSPTPAPPPAPRVESRTGPGPLASTRMRTGTRLCRPTRSEIAARGVASNGDELNGHSSSARPDKSPAADLTGPWLVKPPFVVQLFGEPRLQHRGKLIEPGPAGISAKLYELIMCLGSLGPGTATTATLGQALLPGDDLDSVAVALRKARSRLRDALTRFEPELPKVVVRSDGDGVQLDPTVFACDVHQFLALEQHARELPRAGSDGHS
jgi:hypothetical protein